jgi:hypothetical protein
VFDCNITNAILIIIATIVFLTYLITNLNSFLMVRFATTNALDIGKSGEVIFLWGDDISASSLQLSTFFGVGTLKLLILGLISWVLVKIACVIFDME